jgi:hypothetical protein
MEEFHAFSDSTLISELVFAALARDRESFRGAKHFIRDGALKRNWRPAVDGSRRAGTSVARRHPKTVERNRHGSRRFFAIQSAHSRVESIDDSD